MKKITAIFLLVLFLALNISTVYTDNDLYFLDTAYELKELGLFVGTGSGFELDRAPTRVEGVVLLLRLIGKADEATKGNYSHPFTDVPSWANNFVGYAYQNNLIYGVGNNKYGSSSKMTREQFVTVILRALGYDDTNGDFYWRDSVDKGLEIGLIENDVLDMCIKRDFIRDEVVYLLDRSLDIKHKITGIKLREIIVSNSSEFTFQGISIGNSKDNVLSKLGNPNRIDLSKYGFDWYIYNSDYKNYIQIGIKNDKVVGIYTNSLNFASNSGIRVGSDKTTVRDNYGNALDYLLKDYTKYYFSSGNEYDVFLFKNNYIYAFYDLHKNNTLTSIMLIDKEVENNFKGFYGVSSDKLKESYELQTLDLVNSIRIRFGKKALTWDELARTSSRNHSKDMAINNYFSHDNLSGESPFDRMEAVGINYSYAGENLAGGQTSAIFAHEGLMNSLGHRNNILFDNFSKLGVGVYFGGDMKVYYTQNYYKPMR